MRGAGNFCRRRERAASRQIAGPGVEARGHQVDGREVLEARVEPGFAELEDLGSRNVSENVALGYSDGNEFERHCGHSVKQHCLVVPPTNYKIPLRWPTGKDIIWVANAKITAQQVLSSGSLTKRMMMLEEEQISFRSASLMFDGVEDYAQQIAKMIGLSNEYELTKAGVRTILDIGCGYGSFGAHLFSKQLLTMCIANYETSGSQVQLTLERGLPAMISSLNTTQLPYPSLSFDMLHCLRCGIDWNQKGSSIFV